jgi:glycerol-1-phosphate dehydrogenase [NAD(P)+]
MLSTSPIRSDAPPAIGGQPLLHVRPVGVDPEAVDAAVSTRTGPRIAMSVSTDNEDEAAEELAEWLAGNAVERPFVVASLHGQRIRKRIRGVTGIAVAGPHASQEWARSCRPAARDADAIVAIGGGRCLDVAKLIAAGVGVPFVAVPTQLSHDGICSPVSVVPRIAGGPPESLEAVAPRLAFFSRPTLIRSPLSSLRAGIGDLIANPLALRDWNLASDAGLENVNEEAWQLSARSFSLIEPFLEEPLSQECVVPELIGVLADALVMSGAAMMKVGTTRPASGAEHKISHAIDELFGCRAYHGAQVAFASLFSTALHGLEVRELRRRLTNVGLPHHPGQLGLSGSDMVSVLLRAPNTRPGRFTILESAGLDERTAAALSRSLWPRP